MGEPRDTLDGIIPFSETSMAAVNVKAGENFGVAMIRDLRGAMERTSAEIGIFLTLAPPKGRMQAEAAAAGQHEEPGFAPRAPHPDRHHRGRDGPARPRRVDPRPSGLGPEGRPEAETPGAGQAPLAA